MRSHVLGTHFLHIFHILESIDKDYWDEFFKVELIILQDEVYSREFEGFIKGFSWHNDFSSFPLNFVSTLLYQVHP